MKSSVQQYEELHKNCLDFGTSSVALLDITSKIISQQKPKSIIDYGCGKGVLSDRLKELFPNISIIQYDPSMREFSAPPPDRVDLIINTDVLEHIPENELDNFLTTISKISKNVFFNISCRKAVAILPNGENAHCTIYPPRWWEETLKKYFPDAYEIRTPDVTACSFVTFKPKRSLVHFYYKSKIYLFFRKIAVAPFRMILPQSWASIIRRFF